LVVATARDLQELTHATHLELGELLVHPGVLHGSCCAKYAAAFFKISRSSFKRAFSFRRRFSSSYSRSSAPSAPSRHHGAHHCAAQRLQETPCGIPGRSSCMDSYIPLRFCHGGRSPHGESLKHQSVPPGSARGKISASQRRAAALYDGWIFLLACGC